MSDLHALARYLKEHRERAGLNHREFAEAISEAGGTASTQAVQQWENTKPDSRTTRPGAVNRDAVARILGCDRDELETVYLEARAAARAQPVENIFVNHSISGAVLKQAVSRVRRQPSAELEQRLEARLKKMDPEADDYLQKEISILNLKRRYDYLSNTLAVEWVISSFNPATHYYFSLEKVHSKLWQLRWLAELDNATRTKRNYLLVLVLDAGNSPEEIEEIGRPKSEVERYAQDISDELRVIGDDILVRGCTSPEEAALSIISLETTPAL